KDIMPDIVSVENIGEEADGPRIDNFFFVCSKGGRKRHIYHIVLSVQVRVNRMRVNVDYLLKDRWKERIHPIRTPTGNSLQISGGTAKHHFTAFEVLFEDEWLLVINKPSGVAVHGGSGISHGVIEQLRARYPGWKFLELVHRLDRDTSGILLLAKKRSALLEA